MKPSHRTEYLTKDDMKKLMALKDHEIYEIGQTLSREKERSAFWLRVAFFSWILMIVAVAMSLIGF